MFKKIMLNYSAYIIAYFSIAGYYLAYEYKKGYFHFFNIPNVYINNVDLIDIINMISAIIAFFSMGFYIFLTHRANDKNRKETALSRINQSALPMVILLLIAGYFDIGIIRSISLIIILLILIYNFILPLCFYYKVKGYNNKIAAFFKSDDDMSFEEVLEHKIKHQFISTIIVVIISTYTLGIFVNLLGQQNAKNEEQFNIAEIDEIKHIVFSLNDDNVIATAIINNKLSNGFFMHPKSDLIIKKEKIKKLKVD